MKNLIYLIIPMVLLSCNDGDVITSDFNLGGTVQICNIQNAIDTNAYVFYKLDAANNQSISLSFSSTEPFLVTDGTIRSITLNTTNLVDYRRLNGAPGGNYYCNNIPAASPQVIEQYISRGGQVSIQTSPGTLDDNDGIPAALEGVVFDENGFPSMTLSQDTDGDGIPDFIDADDDNDNVLTALEGVVIINGAISQTASRDTDNNGILDYLDTDDDGDGIPTIQEDLNGNLDPTDDIGTTLPAYRENASRATANPAINTRREHIYTRSSIITISIDNLILTTENKEVILQNYEFGNFTTPVFTIRQTPTF